MFKFSIIVCCYNPDINKLKNTLVSIFKQKGVEFEVIISDDKSKEDYSSVLKEFIASVNSPIKVTYNFLPTNGGTINNVLSALKFVKGKFIKLISPGDYFYDEDSLKNYLDVLEGTNSDLVFSKMVHYHGDKIISINNPNNEKVWLNKSNIRDVVKFNDYISGASIAVRKEVLEEYLDIVQGHMKFLEDVPLTYYSILDNKNVIPINQQLIWYEHGEGVSTNSKISSLLDGDYEWFFSTLADKYDSKVVRASLRMRKLSKSSLPGIIKLLIRFISVPSYIKYYFEIKCIKDKKAQNIDISSMNNIISI